jgi:hypothetical protein
VGGFDDQVLGLNGFTIPKGDYMGAIFHDFNISYQYCKIPISAPIDFVDNKPNAFFTGISFREIIYSSLPARYNFK